jgi:hypothetical protein
MAPRVKEQHPVEVHPDYLAEMAKRCRAVGLSKVAAAAHMSRTTLWALLGNRKPPGPEKFRHRASVEAAERLRAALIELAPGDEPMPPPVLLVRGPGHATYELARKSMKRRR